MADRLLGPSSRPRTDELAGVGTWSLDLASGRLTTNAAARRMLGWDDRQGLPTLQDFLAFVHPADRERLTAHTDRLVREGREYVLEHRALLPGGRVLHLRASATADLDEDGRARMLHGVTLDLGPSREGSAAPVHLPLPDELVRRAAALCGSGRALLGIAGAPGAGTSTVAASLVAALGDRAVLVAMDGFHLADPALERLGRRDRKGAPDTFDAAGYVHLLRRLREQEDEIVWAPTFARQQEQVIAGAVAVPRGVPLVVTEGNYLLADGPFAPVRELLDETWFLDVDARLRRERLVARHVQHGRSPVEAERWVAATDDGNAALVDATRERADLVVLL